MKISPLFAEERRIEIVKLLNENAKLLIPSLCEQFEVSPATIRNDLRALEREGMLKRTHGGAIPVSKMAFELANRSKEVEHIDEKRRIAACAEGLVEDGDIILLDAGTTTMELAKLLSASANLTIVTNDIKIALFVEENTSAGVFLLGGMVRRDFHYTRGLSVIDQVRVLNVDKAFMATNALCAEKGFTTPAPELADVKRAMIKSASMVVFMVDSHKLGRVSFARFAGLEDVHVLITDTGANKTIVDRLQSDNKHLDVRLV